MNIRGADPAHLPKLPFAIHDMAFNDDGTPKIDPETGDHLPMWATLPTGSVILIDEAHKVFPQRGPGRPAKHIEMLAEGRQHGIRFILLTQAPGSMDGFLRDRISRHYHLERKGNMERATVLEFDHCVMYPRTAWLERKDAQIHFWSFPKNYYGWYTSAKSHHMKRRIPWKIWAALAFVPVVGYVAWNVIDKVGGVQAGMDFATSPMPTDGSPSMTGQQRNDRRKSPVHTTQAEYLAHWTPLVPERPWSSPAFQEAGDVSAKPDLYCATGGSGTDGNGDWKAASCTCLTEQGTPYYIEAQQCALIARHGIYNPHRQPANDRRSTALQERGKPGEARSGPSGVRAPTAQVTLIPGDALPPTVEASGSGASGSP
jgi:hypothetical protein